MKTARQKHYIIKSLVRADAGEPAYFCAIHGWTPFFVRDPWNARAFASRAEARFKGIDLFIDPGSYVIQSLTVSSAGVVIVK